MAQQTSIWNRLSGLMCSFMHSCLIVLPWASLFSHIGSSLLHFLGLHSSHYSGPHWDMSHLVHFVGYSRKLWWSTWCTGMHKIHFEGELDFEKYNWTTVLQKKLTFSTFAKYDEAWFSQNLAIPFYVLVPQYNSKTCFNEHCSPIPEQMTHINQFFLMNQTHTV